MNPFPPHWSPEQALAIDEFLQLLRDQLWLQYHDQMLPLFGDDDNEAIAVDNMATTQQSLFDDNDLPF